MKVFRVPGFVILALVSAVVPLSAHHSWPVNMDRLVTVKGTVIQFTWENPHPMMTIEVHSSDGRTEQWQAGGPALIRMTANGWTGKTGASALILTVRLAPSGAVTRTPPRGRRNLAGSVGLRTLFVHVSSMRARSGNPGTIAEMSIGRPRNTMRSRAAPS